MDDLLSRVQPLLPPVSVPLNPAWALFSYCDDNTNANDPPSQYLPPPNQVSRERRNERFVV
jgi:hypothetical protein